MIEYINLWWSKPETSNDGNNRVISKDSSYKKEIDTVCLISVSDLINVKLKPVKDVIPAPARNMPVMDKFKLQMLNQAQLKEILKVKLKPIPPRSIKKYEHRHPVLREMLEKVNRV